MKKRIFVLSISILLLGNCASVFADLATLIDIAKGQADMQREYREETKAYELVRRAVDNGVLTKGAPRVEIESEYGEPVVSVWDTEKKKEKWIYKPASSSFFSGEQVALFFDDKGVLDEIEIREKKEERCKR